MLSLVSACALSILLSVQGSGQTQECVGGFAGVYPCSGFDLVSQLDLGDFNFPSFGNDIWGWTDPETGTEYAIMGLSNATAFVSLCDPENPEIIGFLPTQTSPSLWRDMKVYADHCYIVSEAGGHGMQVFDLTQLRDVVDTPVEFEVTAFLGSFGSAHNIAINEETGYAYPVGAGFFSGGPIFIDLSIPDDPEPNGGFSDDGYTHDAQAVIYEGPDDDYSGKELIFASNEDTFTIIDVSDKTDPTQISRTGYALSAYSHQGWLTEDHRYFLQNDELDEIQGVENTRTLIWDCLDLDEPILIGEYFSPSPAIDHNLYTHQGFCYEANYTSGLRVLDLSDIATGNLSEEGFFDVYPQSDAVSFDGAWSVYPYFESGLIIVSSMDRGLFVLKPSGMPLPAVCSPTGIEELTGTRLLTVGPNPSNGVVWVDVEDGEAGTLQVIDASGRICLDEVTLMTGSNRVELQSLLPGLYTLRLHTDIGVSVARVLLR